jgi:SynChlorMet cassette radical SAM/SPASM protein ScmF
MDSQTPVNPHPLSQLYFYLTEGCNLACRHCWIAPKFDPNARFPTLDLGLFETALAEAKPLGLSGVKLTGGEPTLHPQFTTILDLIRREDLRLTLETNGLLMTPALAQEILKCQNPFVSTSLDGADAATHEWVRGVPGSFDATTRAVKILAEAGLRPQIIFSLMKHNASQVEQIIRLAEQLGAASVKFNVIQPTARGEKLHDADATLSIAELIALGRRVEHDLTPTTQLRLFFDYPSAFRSLSRIASGDGCGVCGIKHILGVLATGQYALCGIGEQVPELIFGQVGQDKLEEVWSNNPMLNTIRNDIPARLTGVCGRCLMKERCLGSCVAQNYYRSHDLFAPFWFCEMAEQAGLFPSSRLMC